MSTPTRRLPLRLALAATLLLAACGGGPRQTLTVASGDQQTALVGTAVADAPTVKLVDAGGKPMAGVTVRFALLAGGGKLTGAAPTTDADGVASAGSWTLGTMAGDNQLRALVGTDHVDFLATATPGDPARIAPAGGKDTVPAAPGSTTSVDFLVADAYGNGVADGTGVTLAVDSGDGTLKATSVTTAAGRATAMVDNPAVPGATVIRATVGALSATVTVARVTGAPAVITAVDPHRVLEVGTDTTLMVTVTDSGAFPVATTVSFATDGGAPVSVPAPLGQASLRITAPTVAGTHQVVATTPGGVSATFTLVTTAGPASTFRILFGDGVQVEGGSYPLIAGTTDAFGNQVPASASFTVSDGTTPQCDLQSDGAGIYVVTGNRSGTGSLDIGEGASCAQADPQTFSWSPIAPWPGQLTVTPADGATVALGSTTTLTLTAMDGAAPAAPTKVTFVLFEGEGDFGQGLRRKVVTTDATTGKASVDLSVGDRPGPRQLLVHFPGQPPILRGLTVPLPGTTSLVRQSPEVKAVILGDTDTLEVQVLDPTGAAVAGENVEFEVHGGTIDGDTQLLVKTTPASGQLSVDVAAAALGKVTVTAILHSTGQSLAFTRAFTAGNPASVRLSDQDHSLVDAGTARPLVATVRDRNGNPVSGAPVSFHLAGAGTITGQATVVTGVDGTATTTWQTPAADGQEVDLVAQVDAQLQATSRVRTVTPPAVAAGTRIPLALPLGGLQFLPGSHQALVRYPVTFADGAASQLLVRIDPKTRTATDLNQGLRWTELGDFAPTADGSRGVAVYAGGGEAGLAVVDATTGALTHVPVPSASLYDLAPAAVGATVFVTGQVPVLQDKCGRTWIADRALTRYQVDLGAATPAPTVLDLYRTSGSIGLDASGQPTCTDAPVAHYGPTIACDGATYLTFGDALHRWRQGHVSQLRAATTANLERHTDAQGACEVTYVDTVSSRLMQVAYDNTGSFLPTPIVDVVDHLFDLFRPADDLLLDATAGGALTLDQPAAGTYAVLGPVPFAGNVETPVLAPGNKLAVFKSKLLRQHDELFLADLVGQGDPQRISQYLPDTGAERDVGAYALWPDGKGLVFLQGADAAGTNLRPYAVTFASVPATEAGGPAATALGFGDLPAPTFSVPSETVSAMRLGGNRYAAFVGNARAIDRYELFVVDRASGATTPLFQFPGAGYPAPAFSGDGAWLAYRADGTGAMTLVDVAARITELAGP